MSNATSLGLRLRGALTHVLVSSPRPLKRLRAHHWGIDRLAGRTPAVELYYEAGDPHSRLCAQLLPVFRRRLRTELRVYVVGSPEPVLYPEADKQRRFALQDAVRIAPAWGLEFPDHAALPSEQRRHAAAMQLVTAAGIDEFSEREAALAALLFGGKPVDTNDAAPGVPRRVATANRRRRRLGHYLPAMWQFDGEWFWGVDRLSYLEQRLRARGLLDGDTPLVRFSPERACLPALESEKTPLEFFFSFRSPYSYLAVEQVRILQPRLGVPLMLRPVLPMAMRGLKVPSDKRMYIVRDVYRVAQSLNIPFGHIVDPIGAGVLRCLRTYPLAEDIDKQLTFLCAASRACWSQSIDLASDGGLRYVCQQAGLRWTDVQTRLAGSLSLDYAEQNRVALFEAGFWGVPSFRLGSFSTWGRDRLWMIEEILRRAGRLVSD